MNHRGALSRIKRYWGLIRESLTENCKTIRLFQQILNASKRINSRTYVSRCA